MAQLKKSILLGLFGIDSADGYATEEQIKDGYRKISMLCHPDVGGSSVQFVAASNLRDWLLEHAIGKPAEGVYAGYSI